MKTYKQFTQNTGKLAVGYASIGHYKDITIPEKFHTNIPIGYFSIGHYKDIIANKKNVNEWVYDHGFDKEEYEKNPRHYGIKILLGELPQHVEEYHDELHNQLEHHFHPFDTTTKANKFYAYSQNSEYINQYLIDRHKNEGDQDPHLARHILEHDDLLDHYTKLSPDNFHVYTGVGGTLNIQDIRKKSSDLFLPAYTSTSIKPHIAELFTHKNMYDWGERASIMAKPYREIIRLHIPKNSTHGSYLGTTGFHGNGGHEYEYLLHRGTHIQFKGAPKIYPLYSDAKSSVLVHDADIIKQIRDPV